MSETSPAHATVSLGTAPCFEVLGQAVELQPEPGRLWRRCASQINFWRHVYGTLRPLQGMHDYEFLTSLVLEHGKKTALENQTPYPAEIGKLLHSCLKSIHGEELRAHRELRK